MKKLISCLFAVVMFLPIIGCAIGTRDSNGSYYRRSTELKDRVYNTLDGKEKRRRVVFSSKFSWDIEIDFSGK